MNAILLDSTGDIDVTANSISTVTGAAAITQHLRVRMQMFLGEWFLDETLGVPWFRDVLIKSPSAIVINEMLKNVILDTPGIIGILTFNFEIDTPSRLATLEFSCLSQEGEVNFSEEIEI